MDKALEKLNILRHSEQEIILKKKQETAVENLILGNDVLAVLPWKESIPLLYILSELSVL